MKSVFKLKTWYAQLANYNKALATEPIVSIRNDPIDTREIRSMETRLIACVDIQGDHFERHTLTSDQYTIVICNCMQIDFKQII